MEGLKLSYDYFCKHDISHKKVGKLIVAHSKEQVKQLDILYDRAIQNNVPDIQIVEKHCISNYEAKCKVLTLFYFWNHKKRIKKKINIKFKNKIIRNTCVFYREKKQYGHHGQV